jgi:hypothetical protein
MTKEEKRWQEEFNDRKLASGGWYGCIVNDGWKDIVLECDAMLSYMDPNYKIQQVKEKFGTLRYYFDTEIEYGTIERDIMDAIVRSAEIRSASICEKCGKWGELRTDRSYIQTLCNSCEAAAVEAYAKRKAEAEAERAKRES